MVEQCLTMFCRKTLKYFLSQKSWFCVMSQKNGKFAVRTDSTFYATLGSGEISGISGRNRTDSLFPRTGLTSSSPAGVHLKSRLDWRKSVRIRQNWNVSTSARGLDYISRGIFWRRRLYMPGAGNDPREFIIIPPSLISRITCKKHTEQEISQNRCVQSINPGFLPSCQIINLSEYKKWEYVRGSHRLRLMVTWSRSFA